MKSTFDGAREAVTENNGVERAGSRVSRERR
jgi:hypothetical protein